MSTTGRWRLFVAVPLGEELRAALAASLEAWSARPDLDGLRWTDPSAWHVTLHFLGATDPSEAERIGADLARVAAAHEPMRLATGGLGGFPSAGRARVAWYGVADAERRLRRLMADVRLALAPDEAGRFRAHVTLARARSEPVDLRGWIASADPPEGRLEVGEMLLVRSHVGRRPARYETLASLPLGARVHA
jgi:2'-5' RNA ligase